MITIAIFMYNEEKYIIETLESIKYQIINFGKNEQIQLIVADDCSNDRTVDLVKMWINDNKNIFYEIVELFGSQNVGTCRKYREVVENVRGTSFVTISGDDMFSAQNLFEILKLCSEKDIMMNSTLHFDEKGLLLENKQYLNMVMQSLCNSNSIRWESKLGSPVLNGGVYKKSILSDSVMEYMCRYKLVDDRPRVYKIVQENPQIELGYNNEPILLSRKHDNSVSNMQSPHFRTHNDDLDRLFKDIYDCENNILWKSAVKRQMSVVKYRGATGVKAKLRLLTPYYFLLALRMVLNKRKLLRLIKELKENYAKENEKHLNNMHVRAKEFYIRHVVEI